MKTKFPHPWKIGDQCRHIPTQLLGEIKEIDFGNRTLFIKGIKLPPLWVYLKEIESPHN